MNRLEQGLTLDFNQRDSDPEKPSGRGWFHRALVAGSAAAALVLTLGGCLELPPTGRGRVRIIPCPAQAGDAYPLSYEGNNYKIIFTDKTGNDQWYSGQPVEVCSVTPLAETKESSKLSIKTVDADHCGSGLQDAPSAVDSTGYRKYVTTGHPQGRGIIDTRVYFSDKHPDVAAPCVDYVPPPYNNAGQG